MTSEKCCPHGYGTTYRKYCRECRADDDIAELEAEIQRYKQALETIAGLTLSMFASIEDLAKHAKKTAREALN